MTKFTFLSGVLFWLLVTNAALGATLKCQSISQSPIAITGPAWLSAAAPPDATGIVLTLYARLEEGSWTECQPGTTCAGVIFPGKIEHKLVPPEKFHMYWIRPDQTKSVGNGVGFAHMRQARLSVAYDYVLGSDGCRALQIIEVSQGSNFENYLFVPVGAYDMNFFGSALKVNINPPETTWLDCTAGECNGIKVPYLLTKPISDSADGAQGYSFNCYTYVPQEGVGSISIVPLHPSACMGWIDYTPAEMLSALPSPRPGHLQKTPPGN